MMLWHGVAKDKIIIDRTKINIHHYLKNKKKHNKYTKINTIIILTSKTFMMFHNKKQIKMKITKKFKLNLNKI